MINATGFSTIAGDAMIIGEGEYRYRVLPAWGILPEGWRLRDVAAVGTDAKDNVYVFHRGEHPMLIFDREGNFLRHWGDGVFRNPHGIDIVGDSVFCTDDGDHTVRKFTLDGKLLLTLGVPNQPSPAYSNLPFHRCTHTAVGPDGHIFVADGYGNAMVHKYTPEGKLVLSWGGSGSAPGEFVLPHNISCDLDGWVYVADRENHRIQVFDGNGRFECQWHNLHRPSALFMPKIRCPVCYVGEIPPHLLNMQRPNLGPRISIFTNRGALLARVGDGKIGLGLGQFMAPHGLTVDSHGDIYVAEVTSVAFSQCLPDVPMPSGDVRTLQKLIRITEGKT